MDRPAERPGQGTGFQGVRRDGLEPAGKAAHESEGRDAGEVGVSGGGRPVPGDLRAARCQGLAQEDRAARGLRLPRELIHEAPAR